MRSARLQCRVALPQTTLNEFFGAAFRKKLNSSIDDLQADLDQWLEEFN